MTETSASEDCRCYEESPSEIAKVEEIGLRSALQFNADSSIRTPLAGASAMGQGRIASPRPIHRYSGTASASFAACAVCFSLRAAFRVCHDLFSVFGFGFSFLCDSRVGVAVVVDAMEPFFRFQRWTRCERSTSWHSALP
jgi:hypothetical protein